MKMGRPTKYDPAMCEIAYNELCQGASLTEVAAELGISKETLYDWKSKNQNFSDAITSGVAKSEAWWMKKGRLELYNKEFSSTLWYMNMKNRFKWTDRQSQEVEVSGNVSIADGITAARRRVDKDVFKENAG